MIAAASTAPRSLAAPSFPPPYRCRMPQSPS
jgi:hypothetical protein